MNLGKWALANLFKGVISAEEKLLLASPNSTSQSATQASTSLSRSGGGNSLHISIERPQSPAHRQRALSSLSASPSINILGIATPALNPAVLPDFGGDANVTGAGSPGVGGTSPGQGQAPGHLSRSAPSGSGASWQTFNALKGGNGFLGVIPASPHANAAANAAAGGYTPGGTRASSPPAVQDNFRGDYFTSRNRVDSSPVRSVGGDGPKTPKTPGVGGGERDERRGRDERVNGSGNGSGLGRSASSSAREREGKERDGAGGGQGIGSAGGSASGSGPTPSTPSTPGLMGKLKGFGKKNKEKEKEQAMSVVVEDEVVVQEEVSFVFRLGWWWEGGSRG